MKLRGVAYLFFTAALALAGFASGIVRAPLWEAPASASPSASQEKPFRPADATTTPGYYSVVRVIDGDTLVIWKDGDEITVRLIGIDTPEVVDPRKPVECFGPEASAEGKKLLTGQDVRAVPDPSQDQYDKYGRMLAYIYLPSGLFYNEFMIAQGFAHEYTYGKAYEFQKEFRAAQAKAKSQQLGFWSPATCNGQVGVNSTEPSGGFVAR